jgi:branched-chain amino acid transport system permease protein
MNPESVFRAWLARYGTLVLLIVPLLIIAFVTNAFGSILIQRISTILFINLTLVLGLQIFMGNSGILNFAHIGFMGIGAYASVLFSMSPDAKLQTLPTIYPFLLHIHLPFLPALLVGAGIAALIAAVVGFPLMRISDAAAVIASFALLVIIHVVLAHWSEVTAGPKTLFGVDPYTTLWISAVWSIVFVLLAYLFQESSLGLKLRASRDDRYAASSIGINIMSVRWAGFVLSAFAAALGGGLWAHFITSFDPANFYLSETFVILAMLVVGGPQSVSGAVVGTLGITVIFEGLRAIENGVNISQVLSTPLVGFTEIFLALAMILILIRRPSGIMQGREIRWFGMQHQLQESSTSDDQLHAGKDVRDV